MPSGEGSDRDPEGEEDILGSSSGDNEETYEVSYIELRYEERSPDGTVRIETLTTRSILRATRGSKRGFRLNVVVRLVIPVLIIVALLVIGLVSVGPSVVWEDTGGSILDFLR